MDDPNTVSLSNLLPNSKNFNFLRQKGMQLIQQLAPATWTDHNLHDPGITLLEALCYALTEAGMRAGAPSAADITTNAYKQDVYADNVYTYITNLLTSGQQIAPQDFFTCAQVLPCSPVSLTDFQRVLLDHPLIKQAWVSVVNGPPFGNLSVLQQFNPQVNNVISSTVMVSATVYKINFIFPPLNDPASLPFQSDIFVHAVSFENYFSPWQQIADTGMYAALVNVGYAQPGGAAPVLSPPLSDLSSPLSVLLQIVTPLVNAGDLPQALQASADLLALTGDNSDSDVTILKQYNHLLTNAADENNDLNSNIFRTEVIVPGNPPNVYEIEIAFPYWDDPKTAPFQNDVTITFGPNPIKPWALILGTDSYSTHLNFLCDGDPTSWPIILRIVSSGLTAAMPEAVLAAAANILTTPSTDPPLLKQYNQKVMMAFESSHHIRVYLKNYRNLCESFSEYRPARIQEIAISAIIEMGSGSDIETLLANIFYSIYQYISAIVARQSLSDLQSHSLPTETIFEGPLLKHGFIVDAAPGSKLSSYTLYVSDIIHLIMEMGTGTDIQTRADEQNRPVISATNVSLSLYLDNRIITTGAGDCLQLIDSVQYIPQLSWEKCNITVTRNNTGVRYDPDKVLALYNESINAANVANVISPDSPTDIPVPIGDSLDFGDYYSIQNDLPVTYGVGKARLPASAPAERFGQAKQLQGYLFFFEQVLAGYFSQLGHVNALFSANATASTTLYQSPLYYVPAASDLLLPTAGYTVGDDSVWKNFQDNENNSYRQVLKTGPETEDEFLTRRHQMLDHLLARLGEDMQDFSSLIYRQSYSDTNSSAAKASADLLQYKADYYYALPDLEKNRAQAYGHPAWRNKDLVKIIPSPDGAFFLWQILDDTGNIVFMQSIPATSKIAAQETAEAAMVLATSTSNYTTEADLNGLQRIALRWSAGGQSIAISNTTYAIVDDAEGDISAVQKRILDLWLKYSLSGLEARLYHLLGIANKGERRQLVDPAGAGEGFYIIEHLFLHPVSDDDTALIIPQSSSCLLPLSESGARYSLPEDPYSFILTVVFPSGYVRHFYDDGTPSRMEAQPDRFRDPEFRRYAEQTIRKFCPAHILPIVVWVDTVFQPKISTTSARLSRVGEGSNQFYFSFNNLELAYLIWLAAFFTDDVAPADIEPSRNLLVSILNGIFSDVN
jgi:hypothetical protein